MLEPAGWSAGLLRSSPELIPGFGAVAVLAAWALGEGGFPETTAYGPGIALIGLLAVTLLAYRHELASVPRSSRIAIALLGGFAAWTGLSILWSDSQALVWEAANRALMYTAFVALLAVPRFSARSAAIVAGAFVVVVTAIGLGSLISVSSAADPSLYFVDGRLAEPVGYINGVAALYAIAFWPALFLATRREVAPVVRGLMTASAGALFLLALMPQSRGWMITFPIALLAYLWLADGRLRLALMALPLIAAIALAAGPVLDVYSQRLGDFEAAVDSATFAVLGTFAGLWLLGTGAAWGERRVRIPAPSIPSGRRLATLTATLLLGGLAAATAVSASSGGWVEERWQEFKGGRVDHASESRLSGGLGNDRYDFWRVSIEAFSGAPVAGIGAGDWSAEYVRERRSDEEPRDAHGLPFSVLAETGIVGGMLLAGALVALTAGLRRAARSSEDALGRGLASALLVVGIYWLLHGSGDWLWQIPATSAPVLGLAAIGAGLGSRPPASGHRPTSLAPPSGRRFVPPLARTAAAVGFLALAASLALPWLAAREVDRAAGSWGAAPGAALDRLDQARSLNPLSARADLTAAAIAEWRGQDQLAIAGFGRALGREPSNWYAELQLAALESEQRRRDAALAHARRAAALNPSDPLVAEVLAQVKSGRPERLPSIRDAMLDRVCKRVGTTHATPYCGPDPGPGGR